MIQKRMGRPRAFDKDVALSAATKVFWTKGYDGASMKDLTEAMGINSPSLYAAFGDKKNLYLATIDRYISDDSCGPLVAFENEPNISKAIRAFMEASLDNATRSENGALGCFLGSCVATSAGEIEGTQERLQSAILGTDERLAARFDLEKKKGSLGETFPSLERARLMFDLRQGHVLRARAGLDRASMATDLEFRVKMILAEPS